MIDGETLINRLEELKEYLIEQRSNVSFGSDTENTLYEFQLCVSIAVDLLKEKKPVEPLAIKQEMFNEFYGAVSCCPKCDCMWIMYMEKDMHYCPECGQAVKWE